MITETLDELVEQGYKFISDEDYNASNESLEKLSLSNKKIYDDLVNYYRYYQIAFETPQRFGFEFYRIWERNYSILEKQCEAYAQLDITKILNDYEHTYNDKKQENYSEDNNGDDETTNNKSSQSTISGSGSTNADDKFSDTPNQQMDNVSDTDIYLTTRRLNDNQSAYSGTGSDTGNEHKSYNFTNHKEGDNSYTRNMDDALRRNQIEAYNKIMNKIRDIEYDFINKFDDLFLNYIPIKDISPFGKRIIPYCGGFYNV